MEDYFGYYNLTDDEINYIQVTFRLLNKEVFTELFLDKPKLTNVSPSTISTIRDIISIPATTDETVLGKPLPVALALNNRIEVVNVVIDGVSLNFLDIIIEKTKYIRLKHKDVITEFDMSCKFYYIKSSIDYILVIRDLADNKVEKLKYSLSGGVLISRIIDLMLKRIICFLDIEVLN